MIVDFLIVSSLYDFSTDLIVQELERRGEKYLRLNREEFHNYRLNIDIEKKSLQIRVSGECYKVTPSVKAIYYRQPIFLRNTPSDSLTIDEQLTRSQWMGFLRSLAIFDEAKWLNRLEATYLSETKAYQLTIASDIGFKIPKTLIGNDASEFQNFENQIIIKSLDTVLLREAGDCLFTYSTVKNSAELNDENVAAAPLTVQQYISPKIDVRVTVIGEKLVAVKITSGGNGIEGDWRTVERDRIKYTEIKLPTKIVGYCFELLARLNLNFGAIDLLMCGDEYFFIEINPTGEWGWLVSNERRIDKDIAAWLAGD